MSHVERLRLVEFRHVLLDLHEPLLLQLLQGLAFLLFDLKDLCLLFGSLILALSFFLDEVALSFLVELGDSWQVVVGSAVAFHVHPHVFKHFKCVAIAVKLEHLSLMLLEEARKRVLGRQCLRMAEISSVVCNLKQRNVVVVVEVL